MTKTAPARTRAPFTPGTLRVQHMAVRLPPPSLRTQLLLLAVEALRTARSSPELVEKQKALLCQSTECQSIWLSPYPPSPKTMTVQSRYANATGRCLDLINATCADCSKDHIGVCSHLLFYMSPQPISGAHAFCSGYDPAWTASSIPTTRWMSFITWRNSACPGALKQSAWTDALSSLREGPWLQYYEAGTAGLTPQMVSVARKMDTSASSEEFW